MCRYKEKIRMVCTKYKLTTLKVLFPHCVFLWFSHYLQWTYSKLIIVSVCKTHPHHQHSLGLTKKVNFGLQFFEFIKKKKKPSNVPSILINIFSHSIRKKQCAPNHRLRSRMPLSTVFNLALQKNYIYIKKKVRLNIANMLGSSLFFRIPCII